MAKYQALFKCQLCGKFLYIPGEHEFRSHDEVIDALHKFAKMEQLEDITSAFGPRGLHIPCECNDGSVGLAYFVGYKKLAVVKSRKN